MKSGRMTYLEKIMVWLVEEWRPRIISLLRRTQCKFRGQTDAPSSSSPGDCVSSVKVYSTEPHPVI
jgi:hypothetical protein